MKRTDLNSTTLEQLVERFATIAVEQDHALLGSEIAKYNALYDQMTAVRDHLKRLKGDQRQALMRLYEHPNWQVRLMAAHATLAVSPDEARKALQAIADSRHYPQAGDAGMSLWNLDRGVYKPK